MKEKRKLLIVWPGYRKYNAKFFERIQSDCNCDVKILWVCSHREDDLPNQSFKDKLQSTVIGADNIRVSSYNIKTFSRLVVEVFKHVRWCDYALTSTQAPLHSKVVFIFSKLFRKKIFIVIEQWFRLNKKSNLYRIYENIGYYMMRNCDTLFVHGDNQRCFALSNRVDPNKIRILPFLSDDLQKEPITKNIKSQLGITDKLVVMYFARIVAAKGLKDLIKAFGSIESELPETVLVVCGSADNRFRDYENDSKYEQECKQLAIPLSEKIIFTGAINPKERQNYIAIADIFVHPHKAGENLYEGWGLILNEVASMSVPIIATDRVGAAKNLVIDKVSGFLIPAGNIGMLAERIKYLVKNREKREDFSRNSRQVFDAYHKPENIIFEIKKAMVQ